MFNLNKFIAGVVAVVAFALPTTFGMVTDPVETAMAVEWAYENELTMFNTVESFMPNGTLTREQGAKFTSAWAVLNLCMEPGTDACDFSDLATADPTLADYATLACQLGLFKGSDGKFMPQAPFTKAQFVTVMMRALDGMQDENVSPRWANYFMAAKEAGITNEASAQALDKAITRAEAVVMLYRARSSDCENDTTDLEELLKDLFGDVDSGTGTNTGTGTDTEEVILPVSNGTLRCAISSTTPAGATVPGLVSVSVAHYECTATTEAVTVDSFELQRQGIADSNAIAKVSVFANGELVSRNRSFNSDAKVNVTFSPKVTVKAGETIKFDVVAKLGSGNNQRVKVALTDFMSNGKNDKSALPAVGNQFEIVNVTPAKVIVKSVGSIADVRLGQTNMIVARFDIENNSSDNNDVTINSITLRDLESRVQKNLKNFVLKQGTTTVATLASTSSKSVTFKLADAVAIPRGQSKTFALYADVVDGAGVKIDLQINEEIYVLGSDSRYGYGIQVDTSSYNSQMFTITAGKVTLAKLNNPTRVTRANKRDVVLANFDILANESSSLLLENIKFMANTGVNVNFENPELQVFAGSGRIATYSLNSNGSNEYSDTDLSIALVKNKALTLKLVADVKPTLVAGWSNASFQYSLTANGLKITESSDDRQVTDIVPGSVTFDAMRFADATFQLSPNSLSNITAVKGATNVEALRFNVLTSEVSPVRIDSLTVGAATGFNTNQVSAVRLYKGVYPNGTLVVESSQFSANSVTFNNVNIETPAQSTQPMYVTIDTVSATGTIGPVAITAVLARDAQDNQTLVASAPVPSLTLNSGRTITVTDNGIITVSTNIIDSKVSKAKVIAGGTTSDEVMAFEINLTNDTALLKNVRLAVSGANINTVISNAMLVTSTGAIVDAVAESIGSQLVFNNINHALPSGTTRLFVKVAAKAIGLNKESNMEGGPFALSVAGVDVEWNADGKQQTTASATLSRAFSVRAVKVTNVAVTSAGANFGGAVTNPTKAANIVFTADSTTNTSPAGSDVKAKVDSISFSLGGAIASKVVAGTVAEIRDNGGSVVVATCTLANPMVCTSVATGGILVDQGSSTTFGLFLTRDATATLTNDALTIGVANTDADITVTAANTDGTAAYTPAQIGLYLPTTSSVANVQLYRH